MDHGFHANQCRIERLPFHDIAVYDLEWQPSDPGPVRRSRDTCANMRRAGPTRFFGDMATDKATRARNQNLRPVHRRYRSMESSNNEAHASIIAPAKASETATAAF
jgi:hypothetical protein